MVSAITSDKVLLFSVTIPVGTINAVTGDDDDDDDVDKTRLDITAVGVKKFVVVVLLRADDTGDDDDDVDVVCWFFSVVCPMLSPMWLSSSFCSVDDDDGG